MKKTIYMSPEASMVEISTADVITSSTAMEIIEGKIVTRSYSIYDMGMDDNAGF